MLELLAVLCAGVFTGAAIYISLVQQPASREVGGDATARLFPPMYRRAAPMQAALAIVGSGAALLAWATGSSARWLAGGVLLGAVVPFTLIIIKPVNDRLLEPGLDPAGAEARELLDRWERLHAARSIVSALAFVLLLLG